MKPLLFFLLIIYISLACKINPKNITGTQENWTGGICCKKGTNYTLEFKVKNKYANNIKVQAVCINGFKFSKIKTSTKTNQEFTTFILNFNHTIDIENTGIEAELKSPPSDTLESCKERLLHYSFQEKNKTCSIGNLTDLPEIAYP